MATPLLASRIVGLDALRGVACILIVMFHYLRMYETPWIVEAIRLGRIGTDIFFVLSGFLTAIAVQSIFAGKYSAARFAWLRVKKVYRTYWLALFTVVFLIPFAIAFLSFIKSRVWDFPWVPYSVVEWIQAISLIKVFSAPSWALYEAFISLNGVFWFIAVIVQMYLFVALCAVNQRFFHWSMAIAAVISVLMQLNSELKAVVPYGLFIDKFYAFYAGMLVLVLYQRISIGRYTAWIIIVSALLAIVLANQLPNEDWIRLSWSILLLGFLLAYLTVGSSIATNLAGRLLSRIGIFSFSVYLLHVPLIALVDMLLRNFTPFPIKLYAPALGIPMILIICALWHGIFETSNVVTWMKSRASFASFRRS
jgi:exopolysaccharide production protein ExoZ